jgi:hypothetical protein
MKQILMDKGIKMKKIYRILIWLGLNALALGLVASLSI